MEFSFKTFQSDIKNKPSLTNNHDQGLCNVLSAVWNQTDVEDVDWSSFSYEDALRAINVFEDVSPYIDDEDEETLLFEPDHPLNTLEEIQESIFNFIQAKKRVKNYTEFIFI
jgi:hypothetical protein